ncbi:MAG: hypothetical protein ACTSPB_02255 [Candidatus Thorarchaeota archaeon]
MPHQVRKCGHRKIGKLYLVGEGIGIPCDRLPFEIKPCECCGYTPQFFRGFSWLHKNYLGEHEPCSCIPICPICHPDTISEEKLNEDKFMLMWVGKKFYTTTDFVKEAQEMGVCKAIPSIPKGLVLGKTWVLLAHPECQFYDAGFFNNRNGLAKSTPRIAPGIFYCFTPQRIEMLVLKSKATEDRINELEDQGITPIIVEEEMK